MIVTGNDFGGPELRNAPIRRALNKVMSAAEDARDPNYDDGAEGWINPIYIVPGSIHKPDFEGYKLGHFSRKQKGLVVMIAVPQSVADGKGLTEFVGVSLREAVRMAAAHFTSEGMIFSKLKAEKIITAIELSLKNFTAV